MTVYVGNISPTVKDGDLQPLIKSCGRVLRWNRVLDPNSSVARSFGFAEYANEDGAALAVEVLGGKEVGLQKLVVKPDARSQKLLEEFAELNPNKEEYPYVCWQ